jgi:MFS family permease
MGARLQVLRHREFRLLWLGLFISQAGSKLHLVAVTWQVYQLTGDPLALGALGLARLVPIVLLALGSGVVADAIDRRRLMIYTQSMMMACALILALANSFGFASIWLLYIITALIASGNTFDAPARQALIPSLVPRELLPAALSLGVISLQTATIVGPTIGGIVIAAAGLATAYWLDVLSYLGVLVALLMMRTRQVQAERKPVSLQAAIDGLRFVRSNRLIMSTMLIDFLANLFSSAMTLIPLFAAEVLLVSPRVTGLMYAAPAVGAVAAGVLVAVSGTLRRQGPLLLGGVMLYGLCTIGFGLSTSVLFSLLMLVGVGAADSLSMIVRHTIRQLQTPDELRGRMVSVNMLFFAGGPQLGEFEAGLAARLLGGPLSVAAGGLACVIMVGMVALLSPELRRHDT